MPNHITNIIVDAKNINWKKYLSNCKEVEGEQTFDFTKVIKMPKIFNCYSSCSNYNNSSFDFIDDIKNIASKAKIELSEFICNVNNIEKIEWNKEVEKILIKASKKINVSELCNPSEKFVNYVKNKYGSKNWYDWSCENWGTKWSAYHCNITDDIVYSFDSAWCPPIKVFLKLAKLEDFDIEVIWKDEGDSEVNLSTFTPYGGYDTITLGSANYNEDNDGYDLQIDEDYEHYKCYLEGFLI